MLRLIQNALAKCVNFLPVLIVQQGVENVQTGLLIVILSAVVLCLTARTLDKRVRVYCPCLSCT